jgi:outer membrane protein OmpA-like peptidoglycan-associated protein
MKKLIVLTATVSLLAACQQMNDSYQNNQRTYQGAGLGALIGAGIGSLTGDGSTERRQRATVGAAIGALAGMGAGQYMDRQEDQLRDNLSGSGVDISRSGNDILLNMPSGITFAIDSSTIQSQFYGTLNNVASVLQQYPETQISIVGHTDSTGTESYNQSLSERRANAVSRYLSNQGIAYARLNAYGVGESQPVASNNSEAGRRQNRRVEVRITPVAAR